VNGKEERIIELSKRFRYSLSQISPETRRMMAVEVEKIVREEIDDHAALREAR